MSFKVPKGGHAITGNASEYRSSSMITIETNVDKVIAQLGDLKKRMPAVLKNAGNRTLTYAKKKLSTYIKTHYTVQPAIVKEAISVRRVGRDGSGGQVKIQGSPLDLIKYQHRKSSSGISVFVKKDHSAHPFNPPKTFIATVKAGNTGSHTGIFQRSRSAVAKKFGGAAFNKHVAKIKKLVGPSVPGMVYGEGGAFEALRDEINEKFQGFIQEQIEKQIEKYKK